MIRGEAGIGKTELLERALDRVPGLRRLRAVGREFENELPFTGLHDLCRPLLTRLEALPGPQRTALEVAFALSDGATPDRFRVGLAVLGLLSAAAREEPIVCVIDDWQWLDHASAQVMAFVARRVEHDPIAFLIASRDTGETATFDGLPVLTLTGLGGQDALALLTSASHTPLDQRIRDQILAEARGNPLALLELPRTMGPAELTGDFDLLTTPPVPARVEAGYRELLASLPENARWLLLLAAAEPLGDPVLLWRAAERLGIGADAAGPAEAARLLEIGVRTRFRHPLVRSAIYRAASPEERRTAHGALAEATDPVADPDRRTWHRAQSVLLPDEDIAAELEHAAARASARGGIAAAAGLLERATALTADPDHRAERALSAARYHYWAGAPGAAAALLATAEAGPSDDRRQAFIELLAAQISIHSGPGVKDPAPLLQAARRLEAYDRPMARQISIEAYVVAMRAGRLGPPGLEAETARRLATMLEDAPAQSPTLSDLLLEALITRATKGHVAAIPPLRRAVGAFLAETETDWRYNWLSLACAMAMDLWDHDGWRTLAERQVRLNRRAGTLLTLPSALHYRAYAHVLSGEFGAAEALIAEALAIDVTGNQTGPPFGDLALRAWRGDQKGTAALAERVAAPARERGEGHNLSVIDGANAVLYNGLGHYDAAYEAATEVCADDGLGFFSFVPSELIEAAARTGRHRLAEPVLREFVERTDASGTDLALGLQAYARALLTEGSGAEDLYREAIDRLARTDTAAYLARAHLVYGEWLSRETRRGDAQVQLCIAYEKLSAMGAAAFAERAARELSACGVRPPRSAATRLRSRVADSEPADESLAALTDREREVLTLLASGLSNSEIAAALVISHETVKTYVSRILTKLDLRDRVQAVVFAYRIGLVSPDGWPGCPGRSVPRAAAARPRSSRAAERPPGSHGCTLKPLPDDLRFSP
ncbi:LuxR family transcriptional regulator [Actinoallomurus spadix]|uniref:LuxR family transcriptional regulator n=1 Tax=Actinoallomurus spadix TaxID=79912 RepID=A0ABN0W876_9ACTN